MTGNEILVLVIAVFALWLVLKLAKIAIRVTFYIVIAAVIAGLVWFLFFT